MSDSLQDLALMVKRLQMRHHRGANEALAPLGISLAQWDALRHLHRNPGASLHDLAVLTFQTDQSFGTLATRLITRGLIERVPGPGRAVHHRLTGKGDKLRQAGSELFNGVLASSFAPLSSEQRADLGALLHELLDQPGENGNPGGAEKSA